MFYVYDRESGRGVFTEFDPRRDRCELEVIEGVRLDPFDERELAEWAARSDSPSVWTGRSKADEAHYRVFRRERVLRVAGFRPVAAGVPAIRATWADFHRSRGRD